MIYKLHNYKHTIKWIKPITTKGLVYKGVCKPVDQTPVLKQNITTTRSSLLLWDALRADFTLHQIVKTIVTTMYRQWREGDSVVLLLTSQSIKYSAAFKRATIPPTASVNRQKIWYWSKVGDAVMSCGWADISKLWEKFGLIYMYSRFGLLLAQDLWTEMSTS